MPKEKKSGLKKFLPNLSITYPRIVLQSNHEAVLEGCKKILFYHEHEIRISTGKLIVSFYGTHLNLTCLSPENVVIHGLLEKIEYTS